MYCTFTPLDFQLLACCSDKSGSYLSVFFSSEWLGSRNCWQTRKVNSEYFLKHACTLWLYRFSNFGYCLHLNQSYVFRKCDVVNRGLSGYNSRWAKILLPRLISSQNSAGTDIAAVTVFFGANDCSLEGTVQCRDVLSQITEFIYTHRWFHNKIHNFGIKSYTTFLLLLHR